MRRLALGILVAATGCTATPVASDPAASASMPPESVSPSVSDPATTPPTATPGPSAEATLAWSPLDAPGPAAREDHTWTADTTAGIAYLFGGRDGATVLGDLWAFDLAADTWTELAPGSPPPARFGHEAAWVEDIGLVIFAGQAGPTFFNDVWAYDPDANAWRQLPSSGDVPVQRYGTCSAIGSDGRLWISHGFTSDGVRFSDTRAYDFASGAWTDETPAGARPVERCLHACWLTDTGELALFGGQTTGTAALGDRWVLAGDAWREAEGTQPPPRNLPAHARLAGETLIFGGQGLDAGFHGDLWLLRDDEEGAIALEPAGDAPPPRSGAALVSDPDRARVLLFGGRNADGALADAWELAGLP